MAINLVFSIRKDRSNPEPLASAELAGTRYVFVTHDRTIKRVDFYLDGKKVGTQNAQPWDFRDGKASAANPWDTASVPDGPHKIKAVVFRSRSSVAYEAAFTVKNAVPVPVPEPTPEPEPQPIPVPEPVPVPPPIPPAPPGPSVDIELSPGTDLQPLLSARGAGVKVLFLPGVHQKQSLKPKDMLELYAADGALIDGMGTTVRFLHPTGDGHKLFRLKVVRYTPAYRDAAIFGVGREGWYGEDVEVSFCGLPVGDGGMALKAGDLFRFIRPFFHHNDQYGIGGGGNKVVNGKGSYFEDIRLEDNALKRQTPGGNSGGTKFTNTRGLHILGGHVARNGGNGIWGDINNADFLIEGDAQHPLLFEDNWRQGVGWEIGGRGVMRNFRTRHNGHGQKRAWGFYDGGICIQHSDGVEIYGVTSEDDYKGIGGISQLARLPHILKNFHVHDCTIIKPVMWVAGYATTISPFDDSTIKYENNKYILSPGAAFSWRGKISAQEWQRTVEPSATIQIV